MSSTIDWCEPNYDISPYVAEFWNTVSSTWIVFLGVYGVYKHTFFKKVIPSSIFNMFYCLSIVGLGSMAFHSYLSYHTQLLDELPMLAMAFNANYILRSYVHVNRYSRIILSCSLVGYLLGTFLILKNT